MTPKNENPNLLDDALRDAFRREDAPEGFATNVLARAAEAAAAREVQKEPWLRILAQPLLRWAAVAAVSICLILGGLHYRNLQRERAAQGEAAKQQLMLALRIAGSKLQLAKSKVNEINTSKPETQPERTSRSRS